MNNCGAMVRWCLCIAWLVAGCGDDLLGDMTSTAPVAEAPYDQELRTAPGEPEMYDAHDSRRAGQALVWQTGETWAPFLNFRHSTNATHARHSLYARAVGRFQSDPGENNGHCSAFLISRDRLATAWHCGGLISNIDVEFMVNSSNQGGEVIDMLFRLGFRDPVRLVNAAEQATGTWNCTFDSRESGRDIKYYTCWARPFVLNSQLTANLHPGDIFGHIDITTSALPSGQGTNNLTVNRPGSDLALAEVLLSPGGQQHSPPSSLPSITGCVNSSTWGSFWGYMATQRDDTLVGSSGGATLRESDHLAWGVANGQHWDRGDFFNPAPFPGRTLMCHEGEPCRENFNVWSYFTSYATSIQYWPRISHVPSLGTNYPTTTAIGGTGGNAHFFVCGEDEIAIGIVGSQRQDAFNVPNNPPVVLGNFGIVCAPVTSSSGNFLQSDYATVRTAGSHDTGSLASLNSSPLRYNRYWHTALANGWPPLANREISSQLCPARYAVAGLTGYSRFGLVRALTELRCRDIFGTRPDLLLPLYDFGTVESGATLQATTCAAGREARAVEVRAGWYTDRIRLTCQ